jgi:hypothetical protein
MRTLAKRRHSRPQIPPSMLLHIQRAPVTSHLTLPPHNKFLIFSRCQSLVLFASYHDHRSHPLRRIDTQGLLDRVFPLPTDSSGSPTTGNSQSSSQPQSYSFRTLLKESSRHPLRVLRVRFHSMLSSTNLSDFHCRSLQYNPCSPCLRTLGPGHLPQRPSNSNFVTSPFHFSISPLSVPQSPPSVSRV